MSFLLAGVLAGSASAVPMLASYAGAAADEGGADPGVDSDEETTSSTGLVEAQAFRCLGSGPCAINPPVFGVVGAYASARTDYGRNQARASANGDVVGANTMIETADATSLWIDEWTFSVPFPSLRAMAGVDVHLDGNWNEAFAEFSLAIYDPTLPYSPQPDDPIPLIAMTPVAFLTFANGETFQFDATGFSVRGAPGGSSGSVDMDATLRFEAVAGRTYTVASLLTVGAGGSFGPSSSDFGSTGELTRVVLPAGVSFSSAAGANYAVAVPEPGVAALLAVAALGLGAARRRV